ncbi:MAG: VOC family protein [Burkholderiaceae bacterium]
MTDTTTNASIGTLDHVVIVVDGLDAAADVYRRLGFTLSPRGRHGAALGTENHTIMLSEDYFELLSVLTPTPRNTEWRKHIASGGGVAGLALRTNDAVGAQQHWLAAGLVPDTPLKFSRDVPRPDGSTLQARFEVVSLGETDGLGVRVFVCSQPTREAVWLPELLTHANSAIGIRCVHIACPDPEFSAAQWQRVMPSVQARPTPSGIVLETGGHTILLTIDTSAQARALGIDYVVGDLAACRAVLQRNAIAHTEDKDMLTVPASQACNVRVRFQMAELRA